MADPAAGVGVRDLDELRNGVLTVANDVRRDALGHGPQHAVDDQAAIVVSGQEALDDHASASRLAAGEIVGGADAGLVAEVEPNPATVVAIEGLDGNRKADGRRGGRGAVGGAHDLGVRDRDSGGRQQLVRQLLVRRDVHSERAGLAGHRGPDALLVDAMPELYERLLVEPDPGDVAEGGLVEEGLGRGAKGRSLGEEDELLERIGEVESRFGADEVVDDPDRQPAGGKPHALLAEAVDDVVAARAHRYSASCRAPPRFPRRAAAGARCARQRARARSPPAAAPRSRPPCRCRRSGRRGRAAARGGGRRSRGSCSTGNSSRTPRSTTSLIAGS